MWVTLAFETRRTISDQSSSSFEDVVSSDSVSWLSSKGSESSTGFFFLFQFWPSYPRGSPCARRLAGRMCRPHKLLSGPPLLWNWSLPGVLKNVRHHICHAIQDMTRYLWQYLWLDILATLWNTSSIWLSGKFATNLIIFSTEVV